MTDPEPPAAGPSTPGGSGPGWPVAPRSGPPGYGPPPFDPRSYPGPPTPAGQYGTPSSPAGQYGSPSYATPPPPPAPAELWVEPGDVRAAAVVAAVLVGAGAIGGVIWSAISPHAQGFVSAPGVVIPDEKEGWIGADGRFLLITAAVGLVAGILAWAWRSRRGPLMAAALGVGGGVGAVVTATIGHAVSSGHASGAVNSVITLPVTLHAHGLLAVEAVLAVGAYLAGVLFAGPDDLGRTPSAPADFRSRAGSAAPPVNGPSSLAQASTDGATSGQFLPDGR